MFSIHLNIRERQCQLHQVERHSFAYPEDKKASFKVLGIFDNVEAANSHGRAIVATLKKRRTLRSMPEPDTEYIDGRFKAEIPMCEDELDRVIICVKRIRIQSEFLG